MERKAATSIRLRKSVLSAARAKANTELGGNLSLFVERSLVSELERLGVPMTGLLDATPSPDQSALAALVKRKGAAFVLAAAKAHGLRTKRRGVRT